MIARIRQKLKEPVRDEQGAVVIILALVMTALLGVTAVGVDLGAAYVEAAEAQTAADTAVLAAGRLLPLDASSEANRQLIISEAEEYLQKNGFAELSAFEIKVGVSNGAYSSIDVDIRTSTATGFAQVFGVDSIELDRGASAEVLAVGAATGVVPISVEAAALTQLLEQGVTEHIVLKYGNKTDNVVNGAFGALEIDGETGGGANQYAEYLAYGYDASLSVGDQLPVKTGNMTGPTYSGINTRYYGCTHYVSSGGCTAERFIPGCPRLMTVPVVTYTGKHDIEISGFAMFMLEDIETYENRGYVVGTFVEGLVTDGLGDTSGQAGDFGAFALTMTR
ncbi:MAG: pilus assembly protein TadG-related protein [Bacillota bacterium]|nr:pilus assembly protein TadG-related protein [Bacillota bacterium]